MLLEIALKTSFDTAYVATCKNRSFVRIPMTRPKSQMQAAHAGKYIPDKACLLVLQHPNVQAGHNAKGFQLNFVTAIPTGALVWDLIGLHTIMT